MPAYTTWYFHEKSARSRVDIGTSSMNVDNTHDDFYDAREMLGDFAEANDNFENMHEEPNVTAKTFYKMLDSATEPLYPNCTSFTTLSFVSKLLNFKHRLGCSNKGFDELLELIRSVLPEDHKLPMRYYDVKKLVSGLSRYKAQKDSMKKLIPKKILRYFPLTLRLQRLFMSEKTAKCMTWHHDRAVVEGQLSHPVDRDEWKQFNHRFPRFAKETRNVCDLILFKMHMQGTIRPNDPTKDFHVYLRPLIDELKLLWCTGVETYDRVSRSNFIMKVALMWTINDFPALGMISGWSTKGKLACPVCTGLVKAKQLKHGGKPTFYGTSHYFLEEDDPLRRSTKFGRCERHSVTTQHSGSRAKILCEQIQFPLPGKTTRQKPRDYGVTHNWTHYSAFFELPYYETLSLRHNIDVMHTEKNVFDNIFYIMLGDKKKTKDNSSARNDCKELGVHRELWIRDDGPTPDAPYVLGREQINKLFHWIKSLNLPDGEFQRLVRRHHPDFNDAQREGKQKELFAGWFERRVKDDMELKNKFKDLIKGPSCEVESYKGCKCNGYKFDCEHSNEHTSSNSGVLVIDRESNLVVDCFYGSHDIGWRKVDEDEDIAVIVESLQRKASQGDFHKRPVNGVKLGTVHFVDGCINEAHYKKTLLAIVRSLLEKIPSIQVAKQEKFFRIVYYNYECTDEEGDRYTKAHIQNNCKQLLSKEKNRADERVKLAIRLGYTHATTLMVKPHYFNEGAWESITKHWETEKFKKVSEIGRNNRAKLDFNHKSGVFPSV
ncbi:hypothetical protein AgCh_025290 [Apium graveolens]